MLLLLITSGLACEEGNRDETSVIPTMTNETAVLPTMIQIDITPPIINLQSISGINPAARELRIKANIDWHISLDDNIVDDNIITISPKNGLANQETLATIIFNTSELSTGSYEYSINFTGGQGNLLDSIPIKLDVISTKFSQVMNIEVEPGQGDYLAEGILLNQITVIVGSLDKPIFHNYEHYYVGDPCLLVIGDIKNDTTENLYVDLFAEGFDSDGNQVSHTISSGTIVGHIQTDVPSGSSNNFQLTLNWDENVQLIIIHANSYNRMIPSFPTESDN